MVVEASIFSTYNLFELEIDPFRMLKGDSDDHWLSRLGPIGRRPLVVVSPLARLNSCVAGPGLPRWSELRLWFNLTLLNWLSLLEFVPSVVPVDCCLTRPLPALG
jgi:hypothetical protein